MARRRSRRGRRSKGIPVLSLGIVAGQALAAATGPSGGDPTAAILDFVSYYTGLRGTQFMPERLIIGWAPWLAKGLIGKVARSAGARPRLLPGLSLS